MNEVPLKPRKVYKCSPKQQRVFGLKEAPTFYPTKEEFRDTYQYIESIAKEGSKYGAVKIVPPASWNPKLALDIGVGTTDFYVVSG